MIKTAICSSSRKDGSELEKRIKEADIFPAIQCELYDSGDGLLSVVNDREYDAIFLDTNVGDSIELGRNIKKRSPRTLLVFVSDTHRYAVDAFDCHAFHYILKSDYGKLQRVLTMLRDELSSRLQHYVVRNQGHTVPVRLSEIYYVEYLEKYCVFHTSGGVYKERGSIGRLAECLSESGFIKVHQGFIVNAAHIWKIGKNAVALTNGTEVMMSVRKKKFVLEEYRRYMKK